MNETLNLPQISDALQSCLSSLDALGLAAAAAFIDSAIRMLPGSPSDCLLLDPPLRFIGEARFQDIDFTELDRIITIYFRD